MTRSASEVKKINWKTQTGQGIAFEDKFAIETDGSLLRLADRPSDV
jgi:hypothetical protein